VGRSLLNRIVNRLKGEVNYLRLLLWPALSIAGHRYSFRRKLPSRLLRAVAFRDSYETGHDLLLESLLCQKKGAFIDVGANIGQTLLKVLQLDGKRPYIGFEPQLSCASSLEAFIRDNGLNNHVILPVGLGDRPMIARFGTRSEDDTAASMAIEVRPDDFYSTIEHITVMAGDDILSQLEVDGVSIIKIDVEGAENLVMQGLSTTLATYRPAVVFECLPLVLRANLQRLSEDILSRRAEVNREVTEILHALGYRIFLLHDDGSGEQVHSVVPHETEIRNYVALHEEDHVEITTFQ
jgi:FkbM family methyltransferase